jgi:hypothetical protein
VSRRYVVAIQQVFTRTTVNDGTIDMHSARCLLKCRHHSNCGVGAAKTADASHDAGLRVADDIVC